MDQEHQDRSQAYRRRRRQNRGWVGIAVLLTCLGPWLGKELYFAGPDVRKSPDRKRYAEIRSERRALVIGHFPEGNLIGPFLEDALRVDGKILEVAWTSNRSLLITLAAGSRVRLNKLKEDNDIDVVLRYR